MAADPLQSAASEVESQGKAAKGLQDEAEGECEITIQPPLDIACPPKQFRLTLQHLR